MFWWLTNVLVQISLVQISLLSFRIIYPTSSYISTSQHFPHHGTHRKWWCFRGSPPYWDCCLLEGACAALSVEKNNMQHICNLFLRHNSWEALTSWIDISTWTSPRHFIVNMFGREYIISQTCSSSGVWYFSDWPKGLGLALCFPLLPIPRPPDFNTIYFLKSSPLHHHYHFSSPEHIVSHFSQLLQKLSVWSPWLQSCSLLSVLHTATTAIFLKCSSNHDTPLLNTIQRLCIAFRIKYDHPPTYLFNLIAYHTRHEFFIR